MDPIVLDSARRHGVAEVDVRHAINNVVRFVELDDGRAMVIGPGVAGQLLEVGVDPTGPRLIVFHAMPARKRYLS